MVTRICVSETLLFYVHNIMAHQRNRATVLTGAFKFNGKSYFSQIRLSNRNSQVGILIG